MTDPVDPISSKEEQAVSENDNKTTKCPLSAKKSLRKLAKLGQLCSDSNTSESQKHSNVGASNNNSFDEFSKNAKATSQETFNGVEKCNNKSSGTCNDKADGSNSRSLLSSLSAKITDNLEDFFERHGRLVATWPKLVIFLCFIATFISSFGLFRFYIELRPRILWLSKDSEFVKNLNWQIENFPDPFRYQTVTWEAENVLSARVIQEMWHLHFDIVNMKDKIFGKSWHDKCSRIPSLIDPASMREDIIYQRRKKRSKDFKNDPTLLLEREIYCKSLEKLPMHCLERSVLEIWGLDKNLIFNLTDQQVMEDINTVKISKVFGYSTNFSKYLGGIKYNNDGEIVSASAAKHLWISEVNQTAISDGRWMYDPGSGQVVDEMGMSFEKDFLDITLNYSKKYDDIKVHPNIASSFGIVSEGSLNNDIPWIALGFILMIIFAALNLGKRGFVEQRILLSIVGIFGIILATIMAYGISSLLGVFYCPVNSILPVLIVGLGVDDMFVIMAAWKHVQNTQPNLDLVERMAQSMRQAGVAITVTSITDVVAFAIGASTSLPALRSFCIYAALGISSVYLMQITFFLAFLIYDEQRIQYRRCDVLPCIRIPLPKTTSCTQIEILQLCIDKLYGSFILTSYGRFLVLAFSLILFVASGWSISHLEQNFDHMNFLPSDSYLYKEHKVQAKYFPEDSNKALIFFQNASLPNDIESIQSLMHSLSQLDFVSDTSEMLNDFTVYYNHHPDYYNETLNQENFRSSFSLFLNSKFGAMYRNNFFFDEPLTCLNSSPPIKTFRIGISITNIKSPKYQVIARSQLRDMIANANVTGYRNSMSIKYISWETNEIVAIELRNNMLLVLTVVYCITLVLLASFWGAALVFGSVLGTMTCIGGLIWAWNVPMDTVSCIGIVLSVGLSVDYAVHVVHMFLSLEELESIPRVKETMKRVGPAVFQGGFSTLITFLLMSPSKSHVFITFFKIFVGSVVFGLYWGLVVLPVVLSLSFKFCNLSNIFKQSHSEGKKKPKFGQINSGFSNCPSVQSLQK